MFHAAIADGGYSFAGYHGLYPNNPKLGMPNLLTIPCEEEAPLPLKRSVGRHGTFQSGNVLDFSCKNGQYNEKFLPTFRSLEDRGTPWAVGSRVLFDLVPESSLSQFLHFDVLTIGAYRFKIDFDDGVTTTTIIPNLDCSLLSKGTINLMTIPAFAATFGAVTERGSMGSGLILEVLAMPVVPPHVPSTIPGYNQACQCAETDKTKVAFWLHSLTFECDTIENY